MAQEVVHTRATTVSIERMSFLKPVQVGDFICCYGQVLKIGCTSLQIKIEVYAIGDNGTERKQATEGVFTYVAIDHLGQPVVVKK